MDDNRAISDAIEAANTSVTMQELEPLLVKASTIHAAHHDNTIQFERSVFTNWSCSVNDCAYCYLSTQPRAQRHAQRSMASLLAELFICKEMGWEVGYFTGGIGVHTINDLAYLANLSEKVLGHKVMINYGAFARPAFEKLRPHISGVGAAIEVIEPELHDTICPSKPLKPLLDTLALVHEFGMKNTITIILGLGESKEDFDDLIDFIDEHHIQKIQFCFLKPQQGTVFEESEAPSAAYMAWWIAKTRIARPDILLKAAITTDRIDQMGLLIRAGINTFSRFPIFQLFACEFARALEAQIAASGRSFSSSFTQLSASLADDALYLAKIKALDLEDDLKEQICHKAAQYLKKMRKAVAKADSSPKENTPPASKKRSGFAFTATDA